MATVRVGPYFIKAPDAIPGPVIPGQMVRFRTRLRNDGPPIRANLWIKDQSQVFGKLNDVFCLVEPMISIFPFLSINLNYLINVLQRWWMWKGRPGEWMAQGIFAPNIKHER
jgi:hypothetical protein